MHHPVERVPGSSAAFMLLTLAFALLAGAAALCAWGVSEAAGWVLRAVLGL